MRTDGNHCILGLYNVKHAERSRFASAIKKWPQLPRTFLSITIFSPWWGDFCTTRITLTQLLHHAVHLLPSNYGETEISEPDMQDCVCQKTRIRRLWFCISNSVQHLAADWTSACGFSAGQSPRFSLANSSRQVFVSIRHIIQLEKETSSNGLKQLEPLLSVKL
jgi:hypothetical protein